MQKDLTVGRDDHSLWRALEDRDAERRLELLYRAAEIRLSDIQLFSRLIKGAAGRDLNGIFQIQQIHSCTTFQSPVFIDYSIKMLIFQPSIVISA